MLLYSFFLYIFTFFTYSFTFFTSVFLYMYIFIFLYLYNFRFSSSYNCMFSYFLTFLVFLYFLYFFLNFSIICVSASILLYMLLNVWVWFCVNVCSRYLCACTYSYLLWRVFIENQEMLTQWPTADPMC